MNWYLILQKGPDQGINPVMVVSAIVVAFFILSFVVLKRYTKVGPNEALIVSGFRGVKIVKGGGIFVFPMVEQVQRISLEIFTLNIKTPEVYTVTGVPIILEAVAQIKVGGDETAIRTAAEQFLSKDRADMMRVMLQTLEGHLRAIVGTMTVEDIYKNREAFAQRVQEVAASDLANMGLHIVSFALQHITDEHGYLDALGKPRTAEVLRDAQIGEARSMSEATQKKAQAEQAAKEAEYIAQTKIAESKKDFETKQAEYIASVEQKKAEYQVAVNTKRAESDLAYDIQKARTAQLLKEQEIKTTQLEAQRKEVDLLATIVKPAEAERKRIETLSEAEKYRQTIEAQGRADAIKSMATGEAEAIKAKGMGEGQAIRAKGLAEAEVVLAKGESEATAMDKKAQAWKQYNEAAVAQLVIEKLPEIVRGVSEPLSKTEKIVIVNTGGSDGTGVSKVTRDVTNIVAQLPPIIAGLTGVDLHQLVQALPKTLQKPQQGDGKPHTEREKK